MKTLTGKVTELIPEEEKEQYRSYFERNKNERLVDMVEKALVRLEKGGTGTRGRVKEYLEEALEYGRINL